jgi:hypothetical protein
MKVHHTEIELIAVVWAITKKFRFYVEKRNNRDSQIKSLLEKSLSLQRSLEGLKDYG